MDSDPYTPHDDLLQRIAALLEREQGYPRARTTASTRLLEDTGMDGEDAREFFAVYARAFGVDMRGFKFFHHFGPEGCNPLWVMAPPWFRRIEQFPLTVGQLVDAARAGRWLLDYPKDPRYPDAAP